jgi:hypothetical protein
VNPDKLVEVDVSEWAFRNVVYPKPVKGFFDDFNDMGMYAGCVERGESTRVPHAFGTKMAANLRNLEDMNYVNEFARIFFYGVNDTENRSLMVRVLLEICQSCSQFHLKSLPKIPAIVVSGITDPYCHNTGDETILICQYFS